MVNITARTWRLAVLGVILMLDGVSAEQRHNTPTPLQKVAFKLDTLRNWGTRTFDYHIERDGKRTHLGTVTMSTEVGQDKVVLHDVWMLTFRGKKISLDLTIECEPNSLLRAKKVTSVGTGDDEVGTFMLVINKNTGSVKNDNGRTRQIDFPSDTLTDVAQFRVFSMLPRRQGASFAIGHVMEVSELNLKGPATIRCVGPDEITLHGNPIELHKFVYEPNGRVIEEAWVDNEGALRQVRIDRRKMLTEVEAPRKLRDN
jgi:hypothetical protein